MRRRRVPGELGETISTHSASLLNLLGSVLRKTGPTKNFGSSSDLLPPPCDSKSEVKRARNSKIMVENGTPSNGLGSSASVERNPSRTLLSLRSASRASSVTSWRKTIRISQEKRCSIHFACLEEDNNIGCLRSLEDVVEDASGASDISPGEGVNVPSREGE